jgi:predicted nucleic acid-binding protein
VIVVDAGVLAPFVGSTTAVGDKARERLATEQIAIPDCADVGVLSVLRRMRLEDRLDDQRLLAAVGALTKLPVTRYPSVRLLARAAALWANVTAYDAVYVALAEALGCTLVTGDSKLASAPGILCPVEVLR